jgi:putative DNA primase/helicase
VSLDRNIPEAAVGRWPGILQALGVDAQCLRNRHGPCPKCGGRDRFRFDDRDGRGTFICTNCGAGDGFKLLELVKGWPFREAVREVEKIVGDIEPRKVRPRQSEQALRKGLIDVWKATRPVEPGDIVDRYLRSRSIVLDGFSPSLRTCAEMPHKDEDGRVTRWPALVALVSNPDGSGSTLHRTWLAGDGSGKAPVEPARKLMPGSVGKGASVRLSEPCRRLGIAEGIETALSASILHDLPVWSAVNSAMLAAWEPPAGTETVVVFGDNDPKFGGQKAAYTLAHRLAVAGLSVSVEIPPVGDWNDALQQSLEQARKSA